MKLRNLFIASLGLLAFAACSNDSDPEPEKPVVPVDAVISFMVNANTVTKAGEAKSDSVTGTSMENHIKTLDAYVFNAETGSLVGHSRREENNMQYSLDQIDSILIKILPNRNGTSDDKFKLVVLANVDNQNVTSLSQLSEKALTKSIDNYTKSTILPMNSKVITFTGVRPTVKDVNDKYTVNNWIGNSGSVRSTAGEGTSDEKEIKMNRMVARVQVESIQMDIADRYPGATFELDTISMVNVRTHATLAKDGSLEAVGFGDDFVKGYQSFGFKSGTTEKPGVIKEPSKQVSTLWKAYEFGPVGEKNLIFDATNQEIFDRFSCYVFPNEEGATYKTALLISGYFKRYANDTPTLKHYMVTLSDNNGANIRVKANNIYKLEIKLNGEGSEDENHPETTASVSVTIDVAPWNVIDQTEEDKN